MRLWHEKLLPYLDRQRLLGQHRELAALRGKGWGKKHSVVDYVFTYSPAHLVAYHILVMDEMERRGYKPDKTWYNPDWRGKILGEEKGWASSASVHDLLSLSRKNGFNIFPEHNNEYLHECINLLKEKQAPIDWEKVKQDGLE